MASPSLLTLACDPSGGTKVLELGLGFTWLGWALGSWFLNRRAPREAGFTEQRKPPAHDSGGITGCGSPSPLCHLSLAA
ncbi:hypothetical protein G2W53_036947 [Senna tora]|uniref:Uncharacterized protein n=1 Tax=Senna tora TaxID=362788 RepID=A0A834SUL0_9FABA|nr:hypothetical protein G2W53_036947 [Senna tora]